MKTYGTYDPWEKLKNKKTINYTRRNLWLGLRNLTAKTNLKSMGMEKNVPLKD